MRKGILDSLLEVFRSPHARNSSWNTLDLLAPPTLLLLASPLLIAKMGDDEFGFWMLINSFIGLIGALNFGLGDATIKYAAEYQADTDSLRRRNFAQSMIGAFLGIGIFVGLAVFTASEWLVSTVFAVSPEYEREALVLMQLGGVWLGFKLCESGCVALVKGSQRYDLASRVTIVENLTVIGAALILSNIGFGLREVLYLALAAVVIALMLLLRTIKSLFDLTSIRPALHRTNLHEVAPYSFWAWIQGVAGSIFNQADKLIIGASISVSSLSVYVVCLQVGQLIHALFAAAAAILFPLTSNLLASGGTDRLTDIFERAMALIIPIVTSLTIFLYIGSADLLQIAFSAEFATAGAPLLRLNALAFGGLALTVIPYYLINGAGLVRINVIYSICSATLIIGFLPFLLDSFGLIGGGIARVINVAIVFPYLVTVKIRVLHSLTWTKLVRLFGGFLIPVTIAVVVTPILISGNHNVVIDLAVAASAACVGGIISLLIVRFSSGQEPT